MITIDDRAVQNYVAECGQQLAIMEKSLLSLELGGAEVDPEIVDRLIGTARTVQAGAGRVGLTQVRDLAQCTGGALGRIRSDGLTPTPQRVTVLLDAIDTLRALVEDPGESPGVDTSAVVAALAGAFAGHRQSGVACRGANWRLRTLLVEDDFTSRLLLQTFLSRYGDCHIAVNGREAVEAFRIALEQSQPYHMICMDIMMPEMDGSEAVRQIRAREESAGILSTHGAKIIMTTAVCDFTKVRHSFRDLCDAYLVKPIDLAQLLAHIKSYGLVE